jgi:putative oxidoreductase
LRASFGERLQITHSATVPIKFFATRCHTIVNAANGDPRGLFTDAFIGLTATGQQIISGRTAMLGLENKSSHRFLSYTDGLAVGWQDQLLLVSRVMVGWIFLSSGTLKVLNWPGFADRLITNSGVPAPLAYAAPFIEFVGGLGLVFGLGARYAALALVAFTIAATWTSHRYWIVPIEQKQAQSTQFWKNVAIIGGLLALFVTGPGRFSLDRWLSRR